MSEFKALAAEQAARFGRMVDACERARLAAGGQVAGPEYGDAVWAEVAAADPAAAEGAFPLSWYGDDPA